MPHPAIDARPSMTTGSGTAAARAKQAGISNEISNRQLFAECWLSAQDLRTSCDIQRAAKDLADPVSDLSSKLRGFWSGESNRSGQNMPYLLGYWAKIKMQDSSGMLEGCRRRVCQVFDVNNWAQALHQGSCLLVTCHFKKSATMVASFFSLWQLCQNRNTRQSCEGKDYRVFLYVSGLWRSPHYM